MNETHIKQISGLQKTLNKLGNKLSLASAISCVVLASACSNQTPTKPETIAKPVEAPAPKIEKVTDRPFEAESLYALLVAEFANHRNRLDITLNNYVQQALQTRDPGVTAQASRLALYLNAQKSALETSLLWVEIEPDNVEAHYNATVALVGANRLEDAFTHAEFLLRQGEAAGFDAIGYKAAVGDLAVTLALIERYKPLIQEFPDNASLQFGYSFLQHHAGDLETALLAARRTQEISPNHFQAAIQEARIMQQLGDLKGALALLKRLVEENPDNNRLRLQYARNLTKSNLALAQEQFIILLERSPNDPDLTLALSLIYFERGLLFDAEKTLERLVDNARYGSTAHYYLAKIAKGHNEVDKAIHHFSHVAFGSDYLTSQAQLAQLLVDSNRTEEAIHHSQDQQVIAPVEYKEGLQMIEANILVSVGKYSEAESVLNNILDSFPDSTQALYTRAMLYTNMDEIQLAEVDLKKIIHIKPNHAAALNALGYTLADRTDRLDEALQYVTRALQITPNDPAVMDSMGWVQYRLGNYDAALSQLRKAMLAMPDHEIAAHLGEVLWVMGIQTEARDVWRKGLNLHPESAIIQKTIERLNATISH